MIKMKALVYAICLAIVSMIGLNASLSGAYQITVFATADKWRRTRVRMF